MGLNTVQSAREPGPTWAREAENVLFVDGAICVRPPWIKDAFFDEIIGGVGSRIWAGIDWVGAGAAAGEVQRDRHLHIDTRLAARNITGISGVAQRSGTFAGGASRLYYADGTTLFMLSQNEWTKAGLPKPNPLTAVTPPNFAGQVLAAGEVCWTIDDLGAPPHADALLLASTQYEFAISFYDQYTDTESNAAFTGAVSFTPGFTTPVFKYRVASIPAGFRVTHLREYRRNISDGEAVHVLRSQPTLAQAIAGYASSGATLGDNVVGPFAPVKNGIVTDASIALYHKERMFFNDLKNPRFLRYSGSGHPGHVDPLDYLLLDDDGGLITGMAILAGQLVILKERSAWILSGTIIAPTNASIATDAGVVPSAHELYQTKVKVGCANTNGGNGATVAGTPARVLYNAVDGLYAFNGVEEVPVSAAIRPTWNDFMGGPDGAFAGTAGYQQNMSYSLDAEHRILFLCQANFGNVSRGLAILAFHLDTGAWSQLDMGDDATLGGEPTCLIPILGTTMGTNPTGETRSVQLCVAARFSGNLPQVFVFGEEVDADHDQELPFFRYATGNLPIVEGVEKHFYGVKWLHAKFASAVLLRKISGSFRTQPRDVEEGTVIDFTQASYTQQNVEETGEAISLILTNVPLTDARWHPSMRVVGFEIDVEAIGQR